MRLVSVSRILHAPIAEVWALTSAFGAIGTWGDGIARVALTGAGVGAIREVTLHNGLIAREQLTLIDPESHRMRYAVSEAGLDAVLHRCIGGTDLTPLGPNRTKMEWITEADSVIGDFSSLEPFLKQFFEAGMAGLGRLLGVPVE